MQRLLRDPELEEVQQTEYLEVEVASFPVVPAQSRQSIDDTVPHLGPYTLSQSQSESLATDQSIRRLEPDNTAVRGRRPH